MKMQTRFRRGLPRATHELLEAIGVLSDDMGYHAYLVGGIVRDLVTGKGNMDLDIVIEGDAERLARAFARKTGSIFKGPTKFGTCKLASKAFGTVDIAAARSETYRRPGALPTVRLSGMEDDLARRDFTVNAMAISLGPGSYGELLDPTGGMGDLARRRLKIMHEESFTDDPTRILRGVRFAARYGFAFEGKTLRLLKSCVRDGGLRTISGKRVYADMRLICEEKQVQAALEMLRRYRVLGSIDPRLKWDAIRQTHLRALPDALKVTGVLAGAGYLEEWVAWFSVLFVGLGRRTSSRLTSYFNLPKDVREACSWVAGDLAQAGSRMSRFGVPQAYAATRLLNRIPPEAVPHLYVTAAKSGRSLIGKYLKEWRHVRPSLTGGQIAALGAGEGPLVGRILDNLLKRKLEGKILTPHDEVAYARSYLRRQKRGQSPISD